MPLTLRPATGAEYEAWASRAVAGYAAEIAASGELSPEAAMAKARQDHDRAMPDGLDTAGQLLWRLVADGQPVGWLWLAVPGQPGDPDMAWVNVVEVDEAFRAAGTAGRRCCWPRRRPGRGVPRNRTKLSFIRPAGRPDRMA